jgi:protein SDA1
MLWFAAIASHELVPPEVSFFFFYESILNIFNLKNIEQMLKTIANNFITERNTSEVIAIGINAIREICARCPLAMSEDLLGDLVQYKDYKDKAVTTSAKSLIQLFRVKNQKLLNRRDRVKTIFKINFINYYLFPLQGKPTDEIKETKILKFGESDIKSYIPGSEVVEKKIDDEDEEGDDWEEESGGEDEDSDDEWNDVSHSSDEEVLDDNEEKKEEDPVVEKEKISKAIETSTERIFTQEDFKKIQQEQLRKKVQLTSKDAAKRKAISIDEDSDEEEDTK